MSFHSLRSFSFCFCRRCCCFFFSLRLFCFVIFLSYKPLSVLLFLFNSTFEKFYFTYFLMKIIRCSGMFHVPVYRWLKRNVLLQNLTWSDVIISRYFKILVIYSQSYACLSIRRNCTLEVSFNSAYCDFWTCFVSTEATLVSSVTGYCNVGKMFVRTPTSLGHA